MDETSDDNEPIDLTKIRKAQEFMYTAERELFSGQSRVMQLLDQVEGRAADGGDLAQELRIAIADAYRKLVTVYVSHTDLDEANFRRARRTL